MSPALDVLAMGRSLVDLYPRQDGPLERVTEFQPSVGGSPTNVAIAAARLGRRAGVISRVGDDGFGRLVRAELDRIGVDTAQVLPVAGRTTAVAICEISPPDNPLTIYRPDPAADLAIEPEQLDLEVVRDAGVLWLSLSGFSGEPSRAAHLRAARERAGRPTVLDLDYRPAFWRGEQDAAAAAKDVLGLATVLIGNLEECRIALGAADAASAAQAMLDAGAHLAVVKLGEDGVVARTADETAQVAPIPVTLANGLGSGDAFGGALCHGILSGWPLAEVLGFANAAGALVASRRGCSSAMPTVAEVEALRR
ncbi:MAG: 5-dehydro-2-deoxygluconokinase [Microbacteriaceae bacterium]